MFYLLGKNKQVYNINQIKLHIIFQSFYFYQYSILTDNEDKLLKIRRINI